MGKIGYARVSTDDQNLDLQRDALRRAGCVEICEDKASGKDIERAGLRRCLDALCPGDVLVVWRLDRLGRNLGDLVQLVADLERRGVGFESLTEKIETASPTGRLVFHVFAALAEFERGLIRQRTKAGLDAARARGRCGGRRPALDDKAVAQIRTLLQSGVPVAEVARRYGVSRTTIYHRVVDQSAQGSDSKKSRTLL